MFGGFKVVHLIGTTRENESLFRQAEVTLTKQGYIVFKPCFYKLHIYNQHKELLDEMCYQKLLQSDIICIVTPGHLGKSTMNRIRQAKAFNKEICIWVKDKMITLGEV